MEIHGGWSYRAGQGYGEKMSAPPRPKDIFVVTEGGRDLLNLSELLIESGMAMTSEYPFVVEILTPTQTIFRARLGWGEFVSCQGM